jgi:hypothetical protein
MLEEILFHTTVLLQFFSSLSVTAILKLYGGDSNVSVRLPLQMYRISTHDQTICVAIKDIFILYNSYSLKVLGARYCLKVVRYLKKIILSY